MDSGQDDGGGPGDGAGRQGGRGSDAI
ncbi:MAG: hypothetical protein JWN84_981, partial [Nocardioides sp.]|nr:hypothetical protein [Nocardioides sp.]